MGFTRRGWAVAAVVATAIASGILFGARSLNAVAAPGVVALLAAYVQVKRFEQPRLRREVPAKATRGETVPIRLHFSGGSSFSGRIEEETPDGVVASGNVTTTGIDDTTVRYEATLTRRGRQRVGPTTVVARDVLGLAETEFTYPNTDELLVRPQVHPLGGPRRDDLVRLYGESGDDRQQFDHLRHYRRGDPLRDIHWKSSAKEPVSDFVVKEFTADEGARTIEIVAEADSGGADAMADAAASVAVDVLKAGVRVGLTTPTGRLSPQAGMGQRERILDHLARARDGRATPPDEPGAVVRVLGRPDGAEVDLGGRPTDFALLAGERLDLGPDPTAEHDRADDPRRPATGDAEPAVATDGGEDTTGVGGTSR